MEQFINYLQGEKLRGSTIKGHVQNVKKYLWWCSKENTDPVQATYNDMLRYVEWQLGRGNSRATANLCLCSARKYFSYLVSTRQRRGNPLAHLVLRREREKLPSHVFSPGELGQLYNAYSNKQPWEFRSVVSGQLHARNVALLGLMVYQGLHSGELGKLEAGHIDIKGCKAYVPSTGKGDSRCLPLHAPQVLALQCYLQSATGMYLFKGNLHNIVRQLALQLRKYEPRLENGQHIRGSVIVNWLRQYNIRQVQYMAGHRHISSTEKYQRQDHTSLQHDVARYHPMQG